MLGMTVRRVMASMLLVIFPGALACAETNAAMASAEGRVTVNGRVIEGKQAIYPGDRVATAKNSSAALTMSGSTVKLAESTDAVFDESMLRVNSGAAQIKSQGMSAEFKNVIVRPGSKDGAQYIVGQLKDTYSIAALHGSLLVSDGTNTVVVREGHALTRNVQEPVPAASGGGKKTKEKGTDGRGGSGAGAGVMSGLPGWAEVAIIGGAIGGVLSGLALSGAFDKPTTSPAAP